MGRILIKKKLDNSSDHVYELSIVSERHSTFHFISRRDHDIEVDHNCGDFFTLRTSKIKPTDDVSVEYKKYEREKYTDEELKKIFKLTKHKPSSESNKNLYKDFESFKDLFLKQKDEEYEFLKNSFDIVVQTNNLSIKYSYNPQSKEFKLSFYSTEEFSGESQKIALRKTYQENSIVSIDNKEIENDKNSLLNMFIKMMEMWGVPREKFDELDI